MTPVVDEVHWIVPGDTIRLERNNIVKRSFTSNQPVKIDYDKATITLLGSIEDYDQDIIEVTVSYMYER